MHYTPMQSKFHKAIKKQDIENIKFYINHESVNISIDNNNPLRSATETGNLKIVKLILENPRFETCECFHDCIGNAAALGYINILNYFLENNILKPDYQESWAIRFTSSHEQIEALRILLSDERVDPSGFSNGAIRNAIKYNMWNNVKLLLTDERVIKTLIEPEKSIIKKHFLNENIANF